MRTPLLTLVALTLAACGGMKTVPEDALVKVPAQRVSELAQDREDLEATRRDLQKAQARLAQSREALSSQQKQLDAARDAAKRGESVKLRAVKEANPEMAEDAEKQLLQAANRLSDERQDVEEARERVDAQEHDVLVHKREVTLREAELYEAQARAAREGGADINVSHYVSQTDEARAAWQQAKSSSSDSDASTDAS